MTRSSMEAAHGQRRSVYGGAGGASHRMQRLLSIGLGFGGGEWTGPTSLIGLGIPDQDARSRQQRPEGSMTCHPFLASFTCGHSCSSPSLCKSNSLPADSCHRHGPSPATGARIAPLQIHFIVPYLTAHLHQLATKRIEIPLQLSLVADMWAWSHMSASVSLTSDLIPSGGNHSVRPTSPDCRTQPCDRAASGAELNQYPGRSSATHLTSRRHVCQLLDGQTKFAST
nr:unnamed protein product [Digitaria exilis]